MISFNYQIDFNLPNENKISEWISIIIKNKMKNLLLIAFVGQVLAFTNGVNLNGWLIPLPGVTPSLFYRFLNGNETTTGMDAWSICHILGP